MPNPLPLRLVSEAVRAAAAEPEQIRRLDVGGGIAVGTSPEDFAAMIAAQRAHVIAGLATRGAARP